MADTSEETPAVNGAGGPSEKEANKPDSPKPDQDLSPPLISSSKREFCANNKVMNVSVSLSLISYTCSDLPSHVCGLSLAPVWPSKSTD